MENVEARRARRRREVPQYFYEKAKAGRCADAGVSLAVFASEYPETFRRSVQDLPYYIERGTRLLEFASRMGQHTRRRKPRGRSARMSLGRTRRSTRCRVVCGLPR